MTHCNRRQVIKRLFLGAAFSNVIGRGWSSPVLFSLQAAPTNQNGFMQVSLSDFPELKTARGSVRISTSTLNNQTHKQTGLFPPVIINRGDASEFYVMSAACTHEDCVVPRLSKTSNIMECLCHGSQYRADGTVVRGPAQQSLRAFDFTVAEDRLTIQLPDVFYEMTVEKAGPGARLKISFIGFTNIFYQVYFRDTLGSPAQKVSFSKDLAGPADQTEIEGIDDYLAVYVDRPGRFGFYEIVMKTISV